MNKICTFQALLAICTFRFGSTQSLKYANLSINSLRNNNVSVTFGLNKDVGKDTEIPGSPIKSMFRRSRNVISNEEMWVWLELKNLSGALKKLAISLKYIGFLFQTQLTIGQSLTTATLNSLAHHCELA